MFNFRLTRPLITPGVRGAGVHVNPSAPPDKAPLFYLAPDCIQFRKHNCPEVSPFLKYSAPARLFVCPLAFFCSVGSLFCRKPRETLEAAGDEMREIGRTLQKRWMAGGITRFKNGPTNRNAEDFERGSARPGVCRGRTKIDPLCKCLPLQATGHTTRSNLFPLE